MKKYVSPQFEKVDIVSTEAFTAYSGCYSDNWLTGSDAGEFYCPTSDPDQVSITQCWLAPGA